MALNVKVSTPKGRVILSRNGNAYIKYNQDYFNKFNENLKDVGVYQDKRCAENLMAYVSFKTGTQQKSIPISSVYGSGKVTINVPYARYQAYSKKIKKRVGKRGTYPWERMVADKKDAILREMQEYSRRLNK